MAKSYQLTTQSLIFHVVSGRGIESLDPPALFVCLTLVVFCPDQKRIIHLKKPIWLFVNTIGKYEKIFYSYVYVEILVLRLIFHHKL